jgi:hypothetical protein
VWEEDLTFSSFYEFPAKKSYNQMLNDVRPSSLVGLFLHRIREEVNFTLRVTTKENANHGKSKKKMINPHDS